MPNTTTATWTEVVTGRKARASEVNGNFDYSEHSLWPHSTGTKVTNTYYLGDTDAAWKGVYAYSIDPLGSTGVAIGTTTVANASSTSLELAGPKAFLLPRLTTTQRDALTAVSGMYIFNTTSDRTELYRDGGWEGNDVPYGFAETSSSTGTTTSATLTSHSGSGKILNVIVKANFSGIKTASITVDGIGYTATKNFADSETSSLVRVKNPNTTTSFEWEYGTTGSWGSSTASPPPSLDVSWKSDMEILLTGTNSDFFKVYQEKS